MDSAEEGVCASDTPSAVGALVVFGEVCFCVLPARWVFGFAQVRGVRPASMRVDSNWPTLLVHNLLTSLGDNPTAALALKVSIFSPYLLHHGLPRD